MLSFLGADRGPIHKLARYLHRESLAETAWLGPRSARAATLQNRSGAGTSGRSVLKRLPRAVGAVLAYVPPQM